MDEETFVTRLTAVDGIGEARAAEAWDEMADLFDAPADAALADLYEVVADDDHSRRFRLEAAKETLSGYR